MQCSSGRLRFLFIALALVFHSSLHAAERVPWTSSRIHGSPEPPAPFRVVQAFPKLKFASPLDLVTIPGTKRLAVVEQRGRIFSIPNDETCEQADLLADLKQFDPEVVESYAIAFHPRFTENRFAYVWINLDLHGKPTREEGTRIIRFRVTDEHPPRLDLPSAHTVFTWLGGGHNGGNIRFGPDGMLYIATGDAGAAEPPDGRATGQDISDVLSSVLRIDVDRFDPGLGYAIPRDNPFVGTPGARGEVWAYGFRNPWRMCFDSKTGALWLGDVGWELWEMIYQVQRGGNYGWSITEGGKQDVRPDRVRGPTPILPPLALHSHEEAASITGGEIYYGKQFPELSGAYIYGDWQLGTFWSFKADQGRITEQRELCRSTLLPAGFGVDPDGELLICDQGGGGLWRLGRNPDAGKPNDFPRRLSETGLFSNVAAQEPAPGVLPYSIHAPRWADNATAQRWIALPGEATLTVAKKELGVMSKGRWVFPQGTVLAKTYTLPTKPLRRIETQLLHFDGVQWGAYSYRWDDAQTDAELVPPRGTETTFDIHDPSAPGGTRRQIWRYFSRAECLRCHNLWSNFTPGFSPLQLERTSPPAEDPLRLLAQFDLPHDEGKLADPHGIRGDLETRARSYLHANCSTCHRFGGGGSVPSLMNIDVPLTEARLVGARPVLGDLGFPEGRVIAPGDPYRSVLLHRMSTSGRGHMPYLGGQTIDDRGVVLIRDWIASLTPETDLAPAVRGQRKAEGEMTTKLRAGDPKHLDDLLATPSGTLSVALAIMDRSLETAISEHAIAKGSALPDPLRRDLFDRFLPESKRRNTLGAQFPRETVLSRPGDGTRGRALFSALCATCHKSGDLGRNFGPDLSQIAQKYDRSALLEQILQPAKLIEPQWLLTTVTLTNNESLSGFVTAQTPSETVLQLSDGQTRTIPAIELKSAAKSSVSLMPEGLLAGLTAQEAADLLQFLQEAAR
jgi:putative heme-binding domain-containing protein